MKKELVTFEFRYNGGDSKTITVGIFDTLEEAVLVANETLKVFEKHFKRNPNYKEPERFTSKGRLGIPDRLVTNLGYLICPFDFYGKITSLLFDDVEAQILSLTNQKNKQI